jgi:serine/threonine protein kinase
VTLVAGTRLGPYEILAPIGAGGMGEVYRARDPRLGREVAVKVLPAAVSSNPERMRRFEKEARAASALNHPNIVTIHDVGESDGVVFLAMELVEGRTLREVLVEGAVATRSLLTIAAQVAEGLAKAHGAGIVHRDLKPENVMVTPDGFAKILDFGLAKLTEPGDSGGETAAPTVTGATAPGVVMGTAGYMSPEQALGKPVDFRSDQFSLGAILYEMATGKRAFSGASAPATLAAIIHEEPESIAGPSPQTPAPLRWLVERCLAKAPDERYASTRDLARDLATLRDRLPESSSVPLSPATPAARGSRAWRLLAFASTILALVAGVYAARRPSSAPRPPVRFSVVPPPGVLFSSGEIEGHSSLSPDGLKLVFAGETTEGRRLYLRSLDSLDTRPLPGTEGGTSPFWSPDSRSIGFFANGKVLRLDLAGGPPRLVCEASNLETLPSWGSSGQILFAQLGANDPGIYVVSASGGEPRRVLHSQGKEKFELWPQFLPDGKRFLYLHKDLEKGQDRGWDLRAGSLDSDRTSSISDRIWSRVEYARGALIYASQGVLLAQPFDAEKLRFSGEAVTLADRVHYFNGPAMAGFSASPAGVIAFEKPEPAHRAYWVDRSGREAEAVPLSGVLGAVRISPDGRTVAAQVQNQKTGTSNVWLYDLSRRLPLRLTLDEGDDQAPVWSGDGTKLFFRSDRRGPPDLYAIPANSPGRDALLLQRPGVQHPEDVSRDGRFLIFTEWSRRTNGDLWLLPLTGDGKPRPLEQSMYNERDARFSPDGRWIAFVSNETGAAEIYLRPLEGAGERIRVSGRGGVKPRWRRDGKELFYLSADSDIVSVPVTWAPGPRPGAATTLFRLDGEIHDFDVDASGQRLLVDVAPPDPAPIGVLLNWPSLLGNPRP